MGFEASTTEIEKFHDKKMPPKMVHVRYSEATTQVKKIKIK